eukprot:jgi/Botrbrau1/17023/Bobra.49_2s0079.1
MSSVFGSRFSIFGLILRAFVVFGSHDVSRLQSSAWPPRFRTTPEQLGGWKPCAIHTR